MLSRSDLSIVSPLIGGLPTPSTSDALITGYNPATGETLGETPIGSVRDVDIAVQSARASLQGDGWSAAPPIVRKGCLRRWADLIEQHSGRLDALDALEMGKPVSLLAFNAMSAAETVRFNAEMIDKVAGDVLSSDGRSVVMQKRLPRGVVAAIIPWNFPSYNFVLKAAPALAAGNTVVLKPSELAGQSALLLAKLALEAGLPAGVLNIVPGRGDIVGHALAAHMDVDMVTFTGSSAVGKHILQAAGGSNMKLVMAECGGKSPQILFDDGLPLDVMADSVARMILTNSGQVCSAGTRVIVQDRIADSLAEMVASRLATAVIGNPQDSTTTFGPLVSENQRDKVEFYVDLARGEGARLVAGGECIAKDGGGYFYAPTILTNVGETSRLAREEIFGPVLSFFPFSDVDDAIRLANNTSYGLAAYVWSAKPDIGFKLANVLRTAITVLHAAPIGGLGAARAFSGEPAGESGIGVEGGGAGFEAYLRRQTIWLNHG